MRPARLVINTIGSLGDLFPFLSVGCALKARGHQVTVATLDQHRVAVEQAGLHFASASARQPPQDLAEFTERVFHPVHGPSLVIRELAGADVSESYARLQVICKDADVLMTSTLAFAGQILGETLGAAGQLRWVSAVLTPCNMLSIFDPPIVGMPWVDAISTGPLRGRRLLQHLTMLRLRRWTGPVRAFRRERGLRAESTLGNPLQHGQHAPDCALALFSPLLGTRQADWPPQVRITGFAHYAQPGAVPDEALQAFLREGSPPLVFTLGSSAVHIGENFLRESLQVCERLERRAVLFTGSAQMRAKLPASLPAYACAVEYAPHAAVFAQAAAIVHHGGIGTSTEALRAGRPMLVVPHGFDQYDNAQRLKRLGVAHALAARDYRCEAALPLLKDLLDHPAYEQRASQCAQSVRAERGDQVAADLIEALLSERG
ncbi:MAG TPA: nucleotide disphospho-sugar-binding domain-containing protein [Dyella sp.]|uniref:glycosyltransferase n=1 Tax=Dyella sp. TaxID=1869338 RepID=UPI002BCD79FB|nr:nucleotide disphospho-sugar-binding domain-containing protein [Dyella sp.]HTV85539.1 nucleotide disphospho-sugar-binding domain-containing protein [Dyella sp.]